MKEPPFAAKASLGIIGACRAAIAGGSRPWLYDRNQQDATTQEHDQQHHQEAGREESASEEGAPEEEAAGSAFSRRGAQVSRACQVRDPDSERVDVRAARVGSTR